jgi:hypothetical protein
MSLMHVTIRYILHAYLAPSPAVLSYADICISFHFLAIQHMKTYIAPHTSNNAARHPSIHTTYMQSNCYPPTSKRPQKQAVLCSKPRSFHQYSKSSSTAGPLFFVTLSCFRYISATCRLDVAISGFLSSLTLMNLGKRSEIPFSPLGSTPSLQPALYLGLRVRSAVLTSQTNFGSNQTSG